MEELLALVRDGGGWAVALVIAVLVGRGDLRLGREFRAVESQMDALREDYKLATDRLTAANDRETATKDAQIADIKRELETARRRSEEGGR